MKEEKINFATLMDNFTNAAKELHKYWPGQYRYADQVAEALEREAARWNAIQTQIQINSKMMAQ